MNLEFFLVLMVNGRDAYGSMLSVRKCILQQVDHDLVQASFIAFKSLRQSIVREQAQELLI